MHLPDPEAAVRADGPWTHRDVAANGARFHIAELGEGPAVLLLHGFPTFWWTWRDQLVALAAAGYRAIAMDLRGYGGSDHPPHGYDPRTMSADATAVLRSLGESSAIVIGHGWGGMAAWTMAVLEPDLVTRIGVLACPHPRRMRRALMSDRRQRAAMRYVWGLQPPFAPERSLTADDGERVAVLLRAWSHDDTWLDSATEARYRAAFLRWPTAHTAIEYHRWAVRSAFRGDGRSYMALMEAPIVRDVLVLRGEHDPMVLASTYDGGAEYVRGGYDEVVLPAGHFVHEERPAEVSAVLTDWLAHR